MTRLKLVERRRMRNGSISRWSDGLKLSGLALFGALIILVAPGYLLYKLIRWMTD